MFDVCMDEVYWGVYGFDFVGMVYVIWVDCVISFDWVSVCDDGVKSGLVLVDCWICGVGVGWGVYGEWLGVVLGGVEIVVYDDWLFCVWEVV